MKFLTQNPQLDRNNWSARFPLMVDMLSRMNADVIAFQEIALRICQDELIQSRMEEHGIHHQIITEAKSGKEPKEGLGVFTRFPILEHARLDLPHGHRIAQRVTLDIHGRDVDIINTHLHHLPPLNEVIRFGQIKEVIKWIKPRLNLNIPIILAGDFNTTPKSRTVKLVKQTLLSVFELHYGKNLPTTFPTPEKVINFPGVTIDFIFLSPGHFEVLAAERVGEPLVLNRNKKIFPSDHYGLLAELSLLEIRDNPFKGSTRDRQAMIN